MPKKILWIDTETTGLLSNIHGIIQFAYIVTIDGKEKERNSVILKPHSSVLFDENAMKIHGITMEQINSGIEEHQFYSAFKTMMEKYVDPFDREDKFYIAGYNVGFDIEFTNALFRRNDDNYLFSFFGPRLDIYTFIVMAEYFGFIEKLQSHKLENVARILNVEFNGSIHDAMADIDATRKVANVIGKIFKGGKK